MFKLNEKTHNMGTRNTEEYDVKHANTGRLQDSSMPYMQKLLNNDASKYPEKYETKRLRRPG